MFGLFKNTYDYYERHDLVAVSSSEGDLIAYHEGLNDGCKILDGDEQERAKDAEMFHYVIEPITAI